jgi:hypothetical protein
MAAFKESSKAAARRLRTVRCQRVLMTNDATNKKWGLAITRSTTRSLKNCPPAARTFTDSLPVPKTPEQNLLFQNFDHSKSSSNE